MVATSSRRGLAFAFAGILFLSPESLLIRLVEVDRWTLLFWRGALMCIGLLVASSVLARTPRVIRRIGGPGLLVAALFALQTVLFIVSITNTAVANTLVAVSAAPLFAAVYQWIFFRQPISRRLLGVIVVAIVGIAVMVSGSLGGGTLLGDLAGLGAAAGLGGSFVVIGRNPDRSMVPAMGLGGLIAALAALPWADPMSATASDFRYLAISGFLVLPLGFGLLAVAPRYIAGAEVALITLLETVLGPLWVWMALGEVPPSTALVGGAIVIGALAFNSVAMLRASPLRAHAPVA
ncbi:MAG TPA: DMT family transporter [Acidimicrobiia bacterium]|nr:DMT family transporter [Acidimicrobiia bacterium]